MLGRVAAGAMAGAAATTALEAVTYLDMLVRGRPASRTPQQTVDALAARLGVEIPGEEATRDNRLSALGSLASMATGVGMGVTYGVLDALRLAPRSRLGGLLAGAGVMTATNGAMVALGVTDPRQWSLTDWLGDVVPHAAFGLVLTATYQALRPPAAGSP